MSITQFPDEIVRRVLFFLPPLDTLQGVARTCRRLARVSNEGLIWRHHCIQSFRYWHSSHGFKTLLRLPASQTNWKHLFLSRLAQNRQISRLLDDILRTKVGRLQRIAQIADFGFDAKDLLLQYCNADDSFQDVLARRYWAGRALEAVHRKTGVDQWVSLASSTERNDPLELEKSLGAFEMFFLEYEHGELDDISALLEGFTATFLASHPELDDSTTRQKALALNRWIRAEGLTGLKDPERDYRNLRNCLIGQALQHEDHESIPIISSAIFCCIAQRIGLNAKCCAFPSHVHAVVSPEQGLDLDDLTLVDNSESQGMMYLDPYGSDDEIPVSELLGFLARFGWQTNATQAMAPVPTSSIVIRTAANIRMSYETYRDHRNGDTSRLSQLIHSSAPYHLTAGLYASHWATMMFKPTTDVDWEQLFCQLRDLASRTWPEDVWLFERHVMPLYERFASGRQRFRLPEEYGDDAWHMVRFTQHSDDMSPVVFPRSDKVNAAVPFGIGQVFRHRRYGWLGVISGWTTQGTRSLAPSAPRRDVGQTGPEGSNSDAQDSAVEFGHTFYTYIRAGTAERFVISVENIVIVDDSDLVQATSFPYAGKFFKRFDPDQCRFISNMTEEYPDN